MDTQLTDGQLSFAISDLLDSEQSESWILWGIGGIPIVLTFFQTIFALIGIAAASAPVVGPIASYLRSFDFLNQVAIIFFESSTTIAVLFVVITIAWVALGVALANKLDRKYVWGAALSASVFYFVLFFGVYWDLSPLASSEFPLTQRLAFFVVPFGASGAVFGSAYFNPDLAREILAILSEAESELNSHKREFRTKIDEELGDDLLKELETEQYRRLENNAADVDLADLLSVDVGPIRDILEDHREEIEEVEAEIDDIEGFDEATDRLLERAKTARASVRTLRSPEAVVAEPEERLRRTVGDSIEAILQNELREFKSHHDGNYSIQKLGKDLQTVELDSIGGSTSVSNSANYFEDRIEEGVDLQSIIKDFQLVVQRIDEIDAEIADQQENLDERIAEINESLSDFEDWADQVDPQIRDEIDDIFDSDHRNNSHISRQSVENKIKTAREHHYECEWFEQNQTLDYAAREADLLITTMEYVSTLASSAESGTSGIGFQIPTDPDTDQPVLTDENIEHLDNLFSKTYDVGLSHEAGKLSLTAGDETETDTTPETDTDPEVSDELDGEEVDEVLNDDIVSEGVSTLLGSIPRLIDEQREGERPDDVGENHYTISTDGLPPIVTEDQVLNEFRSFLSGDEHLEKVAIDKTGDQAMITIVFQESAKSMEDVIMNAKRSYNNE